MIGVIVARHILIVLGLFSLGLFWLSLIPVGILVIILGYIISSRQITSWKNEIWYVLRQIGIFGAWSLILLGIWTFSDIIGDQRYRSIGILIVQIIGRGVGIIIKNTEMKRIFHRGYYFSIILVLFSLMKGVGIGYMELIESIAAFGWLTIGIYATIIFVLSPLGYTYDAGLPRALIAYILIELMYLIITGLGDNQMIGILLGVLAIMLLVWYLKKIIEKEKYVPLVESQDYFHDLLYSDELPSIKPSSTPLGSHTIEQRLIQNLSFVMSLLSICITLLVAIALYQSLYEINGSLIVTIYTLTFAYSVTRFIIREYTDVWVRGRRMILLFFFVVGYISLLGRFNAEILSVLVASMLVGWVLGLFLLYDSRINAKPILFVEDRIAGLWGIGILTCVVSFLFFRLPFSMQFIFACACIYLGVQGVFFWYIAKSIGGSGDEVA